MNLSNGFSLVAFAPANPLMGLATVLPVQAANWADLVTVLMVGLSSAFALQLLLLCLGGAIAASVIPLPLMPAVQSQAAQSQASTPQAANLPISTLVGTGILSTINSVLFVASFLAVTFVHFNHPLTGAIAGIVLWSVYLGIIAWLSFTTVNAVAEGFFNIATVGLRRVVSSIVKTFNPRNDEQALLQERISLAVHEEVQTAFNALEQTLTEKQAKALPSLVSVQQPLTQTETPRSTSQASTNETLQINIELIWQQLVTYLNQTNAKKLTSKQLDRTLKQLLVELEAELPEGVVFPSMNYDELAASINQRQDLSDKKKVKIIHQVQTGWAAIAQRLQQKVTASNETTLDAENNTPLADTVSDPVLPATAEDDSPTLSLPDAATLQGFAEAINQQVLAQVAAVLQQHWTDVVPLVAPMFNTVARSTLESAIESIRTSIESEPVKAQVEQLLTKSQVQLTGLNQAVGEQAEHFRDRISVQVTALQQSIQQGMQVRLQALQADIQHQLETTRKTVATMLWWLFATVFTSGLSAALAGAIAAGGFHRF